MLIPITMLCTRRIVYELYSTALRHCERVYDLNVGWVYLAGLCTGDMENIRRLVCMCVCARAHTYPVHWLAARRPLCVSYLVSFRRRRMIWNTCDSKDR